MADRYIPNVSSDSARFRETANRTRRVNSTFFVPRGGVRF